MKPRFTAILLICLILSLSFSNPVYAEEFTSQRQGLDVMFVIDGSGSMITNDPQRTGMSMVKAFINTVHIEDIRIGYVVYSDRILASAAPTEISDKAARDGLTASLDAVAYTGDTDMGMGLSTALGLMEHQTGRTQAVVMISDGVTDLPRSTARTVEQSKEELRQSVQVCAQEGIRIYGVAFGQYEGSEETLKQSAAATGGQSYQVTSPENLIEILYGIFDNTLSYKIQLLSSGIYGDGDQEIQVALNEPYLDEMDLLLISSGNIGSAVIRYGENDIPVSMQGTYGVGKIGYDQISGDIKEMTLRTSTVQGQSLKLYLISYRQLLPVLNIDRTLQKNKEMPYQVYFKDKAGNVISDDDFYSRFQWQLTAEGADVSLQDAAVKDGVLEGNVRAGHSGPVTLHGTLSDKLGAYPFTAQLTAENTPPSGSLPEIKFNSFSKGVSYDLNQYFKDEDGDSLTYTIKKESGDSAADTLNGATLAFKPEKGGVSAFTLSVSDGESTFSYPVSVHVEPLWKTFWWVPVILLAAVAAILFRIFYKPKPQLEILAEEKRGNQFNGKIDAYLTVQPEGTEEIPPLTFPMYKIKDTSVCLGDLMKEFPEITEALRLDQIYLIADEGRKMILYHTSPSTIMVGSSILCRQIQYRLSVGDIIYITAPDGAYELELHYIAVIQ